MVLELSDISYSREETIRAFSDFYEFLRKLYLRDCDVIYPPPCGWPSIVNADPEVLQAFGKSEEVLSLLAHLPYIRAGQYGVGSDPEVYPNGGHMADWQHMFANLPVEDPVYSKKLLSDHLEMHEDDLYPLKLSHVIPIMTCSYSPQPVVILDTERGTLYWEQYSRPRALQERRYEHPLIEEDSDYGCCEEGESSGEDDGGCTVELDELMLDDGPPTLEEPYFEFRRNNGAWSIPDFFEVLKHQFIHKTPPDTSKPLPRHGG